MVETYYCSCGILVWSGDFCRSNQMTTSVEAIRWLHLSTAYRTDPILFQIILVRWGLDPAKGFQAWCLWVVGIYVFSSGKAWVISLLTLIQNLDRFLTEPSLRNHLEPVEVLGSIIAAVCHDLDHPGLTDMTWFHWTSGSWCSLYTHDVTKLFQSFSLTLNRTFLRVSAQSIEKRETAPFHFFLPL